MPRVWSIESWPREQVKIAYIKSFSSLIDCFSSRAIRFLGVFELIRHKQSFCFRSFFSHRSRVCLEFDWSMCVCAGLFLRAFHFIRKDFEFFRVREKRVNKPFPHCRLSFFCRNWKQWFNNNNKKNCRTKLSFSRNRSDCRDRFRFVEILRPVWTSRNDFPLFSWCARFHVTKMRFEIPKSDNTTPLMTAWVDAVLRTVRLAQDPSFHRGKNREKKIVKFRMYDGSVRSRTVCYIASTQIAAYGVACGSNRFTLVAEVIEFDDRSKFFSFFQFLRSFFSASFLNSVEF